MSTITHFSTEEMYSDLQDKPCLFCSTIVGYPYVAWGASELFKWTWQHYEEHEGTAICVTCSRKLKVLFEHNRTGGVHSDVIRCVAHADLLDVEKTEASNVVSIRKS